MSLRDYFAAHCPEQWIERNIPTTMGDMRDVLIQRGIIPQSRLANNVISSYDASEVSSLEIALRWEYADAMIKEREK